MTFPCSTPLLFLDFDGVLHEGSAAAFTPFALAPSLSDALHDLELRIVVSSSWRFHRTLDEICAALPPPLANRVIGTTGKAHVGRWARFEEIKAWLREHGETADWRALDDATFEFPNPCRQLIACSPREGFGARQAEALRDWLVA